MMTWIAIGILTLLACFWAWWGAIENFHEGWYFPSLWKNLRLFFIQYTLPSIIVMALAVTGIISGHMGGVVCAGFGIFLYFFFRKNYVVAILIGLFPLSLVGLLFWFGSPVESQLLAVVISVGLPLLVLFVTGLPHAVRVSRRINDGNLGIRYVQGNRVNLEWAPLGPGWPVKGGFTWEDAKEVCERLDKDGFDLKDTSEGGWQLPSVEQVVRSLTIRGTNAGGVWDAVRERAGYIVTPEKETPLWNVYSRVIYWWTSTEAGDDSAYVVSYNGRVMKKKKGWNLGSVGFRAVREKPTGTIHSL